MALFSCTPVDFPEALPRTPVVDKPNIYVTPYPTYAEVKFDPVRNADSYTIIKNKGQEDEKNIYDFDLVDGSYTFNLYFLDPDTKYTLEIEATNNAEGNVSTTDSIEFYTKPDTGEIDYAPKAYVAARDVNSVTIEIKAMPKIDYNVTLNLNGVPVVGELSDTVHGGTTFKTVTFTGLEKDSTYSATITHRKGMHPISNHTTELVIPPYRVAFEPTIELTMEGAEATIKDAKGKQNMTMLFYGDNTGKPTILETKKTAEGLSMDIDSLGALKSGVFCMVLTDAAGTGAIYSNPIYHTTPITPIKDEQKSNQQTAHYYWDEGINKGKIIYNVVVTDAETGKVFSGAKITNRNGMAYLSIDNLVSNRTYNMEIEAMLPNGESSTSNTEFKTPSFAGIYRWVSPVAGSPVSSFVIEVWDKDIATKKIANDEWKNGVWNDDFPYHIFVHESDPSYIDAMDGVPIMPLFQSEDEIPAGTISYANGNMHYQIGYRWNEGKWNTTTKKPSKWKPGENIIDGDKITSLCDSWPVIGQVSTKTDFTFRVEDGKPQVVFRNAGDGPKAGFVNLGLFQNPSPEPGTDKFTFILDRIGSIDLER